MLGIDDPWIFLVYILTILSALLGIIYGIVNWNKGAESEAEEIKEEELWEEEKTTTVKKDQSPKKTTKKPAYKNNKGNTSKRRIK